MTKLCECGCGEPVSMALRTDAKLGWVKGEPLRFVNHHRSRLPVPARDKANRSRTRPLADRFAEKYVVERDGCWRWFGAQKEDGYGSILAGGRITSAHRVAYELHNGPIPVGAEVHHVCARPWCVNPDHLVLVTRAEHSRIDRRTTVCRRGHPKRPAPSGKWVCPTCQIAATRRYQQKVKVSG